MDSSLLSRLSLDGKVAIVTGASRGIGEEIARTYAIAGARVVICGRKQPGIQEAASRIRESGGDVLPVVANVSTTEDRAKLVQAAMDWGGRIDVLVNNAGANPFFGPLAEVSEPAWDKAFDTNLKGPLFLSQLAYNAWMKDHGGVILNVASAAGYLCATNFNTYNTSKAALIHLTKCLASEWGRSGVRVNALAPGLIKTRFSRALWEGSFGAKAIEVLPIARIGTVDEIAGAALMLVSDAASYITGHTLVIDGGQLVASTD